MCQSTFPLGWGHFDQLPTKEKEERGHRKHCLTLLQHHQCFDQLSCNVKDSRGHHIPMPLNKQITEESQHLEL